MDIFDIIKKRYPPATTNNSRSIIMRKIQWFNEYPNEKLGREIEKLTGIAPDWSNADSGEHLSNREDTKNYE